MFYGLMEADILDGSAAVLTDYLAKIAGTLDGLTDEGPTLEDLRN